jgi:SAM-dependent methyltransferase
MQPSATTFRQITNKLRGRGRSGNWLRLPESAAGDTVVKPAPYLPIYEQLLAPLRKRVFTLLELGVWGGHSLEMWRDAFPQATVIGVDLLPPDRDFGPRVHVIRGDQGDAALMRDIRDKYAPDGFDVVVDDASHIGINSARSLQALYSEHLRPGGLYCIEDWGTGYLPDWHDGGPLASPLDVRLLDNVHVSTAREDRELVTMPSHDMGLVGVIKRLIDHTAAGTMRFAQRDAVGDVLSIESMTIWDGIIALRKFDG